MTFWAYILHCRGGYLYVGQTDDLERRIAQHRTGAVAGFAADQLPVELAWSQAFRSHYEARAAEDRIKGLSKAKKLALIRGDWDRVAALAKGKDSPSTGSGRTGLAERSVFSITDQDTQLSPTPVHPEPVEGLSSSLHPHPGTPPLAASAVTVRLRAEHPHWLRIRWRIEHPRALVVPPLAGRQRADGLWRATCFELFVAGEGAGTGYSEFNFSPSERWAAYDFTGYRAGMTDRAVSRAPICAWRPGGAFALFDAAVPWTALPPRPWHYGLSAVISEEGGAKSYWALAHGGDTPDFHDPACFAATLAAPARL